MSSGGSDQEKNIKAPPSLYDRISEGGEKGKSLFACARIHRVPKDLRKLKESAYIPRLIAIGPLHRDIEQLQEPMRDVKKYYTFYLLDRVAEGKEDNTKTEDDKRREVLQECEKEMKKWVHKAKKHYAEEVKVKDDDEMAEMMLVDGCFILELLYSSHSQPVKASNSSVPQPINDGDDGSNCGSKQAETDEETGESDPILDSQLTAEIVKRDLLLLENQIPFFVLKELFKLTVDKIPGENKLSLTEYVLSYFGGIMRPEGENSGSTKTGCFNSPSESFQKKNSPSECVVLVRGGSTEEKEQEKELPGKTDDEEPYHILHLLHEHYLPEKNKKPSGEKTTVEVRASDLNYAGVKFVGIQENNIFAVNFKEPKFPSWWFCCATFEIPNLPIHDHTEPFLRNLIALEQCCPGVSLHFTSYAKLMDLLINSKEDVQVLQKAKVIHHYLGSEKEVSDLVNNLCKEVVLGQFYFSDEFVKAFNYAKHWWPQSRAYVTRRFFSSPWAFIGFILALATFVIQITTFGLQFA